MITLKGLIIYSQNVNENDRYLSALTEEMGVVRFMAKGAQKNTSKSNASAQLFAYAELCLNEYKDRYYLESAKPINIFFGIREDFESFALASYMADVMKYAVTSFQPQKEVVRLMLNCFYFLAEKKFSPKQLKAVFELRFACCAGHMPGLVGCNECYKVEDEEMFLIYRSGTLLCGDHYRELVSEDGAEVRNISAALSPAVLHAVRTVCLMELKDVFGFRLSGAALDKFAEIAENYLLVQLDHHFDTLDFYKNIKEQNYE